MMHHLTLRFCNKEQLRWCQEMVMQHHYLHTPVDARCSPVGYQVLLTTDNGDEVQSVGCLIFGRPEATRVLGWYGSLDDVANGVCRLSRWSVINLARVWLSPLVQQGGTCYIPNAASYVIGQALRRIGVEYLLAKPPVWVEQPYEITECLSYCMISVHQGTIYKASNFRLMRTNERGIQTWMRPLRHLTHAEHAQIQSRSCEDARARRLRSAYRVQQLPLVLEHA